MLNTRTFSTKSGIGEGKTNLGDYGRTYLGGQEHAVQQQLPIKVLLHASAACADPC